MRLLCFGDIVGRPGRAGLKAFLGDLKRRYQPDLIMANGENAAGGLGIDLSTAVEIRQAGVDFITLGDHAWQKKESADLLEKNKGWIIRPANYPGGAPGQGWAIVKAGNGKELGVINLLGRVFLNNLVDCPFRAAEAILSGPLAGCRTIVCDIHAEATSEKEAIAKHFDGRISLVFGTHTHVQTADERVLSGGTAFITDLGMCGSQDGVIGMDKGRALSRFLSGISHSYEVAKGEPVLSGISCEIDEETGKALSIERVVAKGG